MEIEGWIREHEREMVEDIRRLVRIPSVSRKQEGEYPYGKDCAEAALCMRRMAEGYGLETEDCGGQCVRIFYGSGEREIEIWNHLDVVPEGDGWIYPPFGCTQVGDYLIGRGVSDNKGPAVAVLYAMRYLKEEGIRLHYRLKQVCGLSEETGMEDAEWYVSRYGSPDFAIVSDCRFPLCYGEMGKCRIVVETADEMKHIKALNAGVVSNSVAGCAELELWQPDGEVFLKAEGVAGHAAAPEKCVNPIGLLAVMVERREELLLSEAERAFFGFLKLACSEGYGEGIGIGREDRAFGKMTCAGTLLRLNEGKASLEFDLRFPPAVDMEKVIEELGKVALAYGLRVTESGYTGGYEQDLESPYIQTLLEAYRQEYGDLGEPYVMGGNTYGRFFERSAGFGPGRPKAAGVSETAGETKAAGGHGNGERLVEPEALGEPKLPAGHGGGHACDELQSVSSLCRAIKIYVSALLGLEEMVTRQGLENGIAEN